MNSEKKPKQQSQEEKKAGPQAAQVSAGYCVPTVPFRGNSPCYTSYACYMPSNVSLYGGAPTSKIPNPPKKILKLEDDEGRPLVFDKELNQFVLQEGNCKNESSDTLKECQIK